MNILNWISGLARGCRQLAVRHAPGILMGMGTVGTITSVIFAAKAAPAAERAVWEARTEKTAEKYQMDPDEVKEKCDIRDEYANLTLSETVQTAGKYYIPAAGMALFALICFWAAHGIDLKRQAVVAGLYSTAEATLNEYQRKVVEMLGEKQAGEIRQSIGDDHVQKAQQTLPPPPEDFDLGSQKWCYLYGRRFPCSYNRIKEVQNEINDQMFREMYASEAELFWKLDPTGEWLKADSAAKNTGWTVDSMLVLRVNNPASPMLDISYEDKYGNSYMPTPGYSATY